MRPEDIIEIKVDSYHQRMREMADKKNSEPSMWVGSVSSTDMFERFVLEKFAELEARLDTIDSPEDPYPGIQRSAHNG